MYYFLLIHRAHGYDDVGCRILSCPHFPLLILHLLQNLELVSTRREDKDVHSVDETSAETSKQADMMKDDPEKANEVAKDAGV